MTVISRYPESPHVHFDSGLPGTLMNHAGCCSPPYEFHMNGAPFRLISIEIVASYGASIWTTNTGASITIPAGTTGTFIFPETFTGVTSVFWDQIEGSALIDNLVFSAVANIAGSAVPDCLTNPADPGGGVLGATVQTFIDLGVDPAITCIENKAWTDPTSFALGSYVKGAELFGGTPDPTNFTFNFTSVDGTAAGNANSRDFFWVADQGNGINFGNGVVGGAPSQGIIWDLGGQANQVAVFVFVDHGPIPQETLESSVWLSNDPNAPDSGWTQALLDHVYLQGWSPDPNIADGFVGVYRVPNNQTFRYVSVTWGGPAALNRDGDNEIDAVGGLTATGQGLGGL